MTSTAPSTGSAEARSTVPNVVTRMRFIVHLNQILAGGAGWRALIGEHLKRQKWS